ncbi:Glycyl-glycine endopeptidase LytM precursor [Streptomyces sp. YIM 130001]|uniref:M23 family metallopeptidase n=1 Tax=Streptomyces sp. YIM 130001 TaxID=2259644 RepID=UPI000E64BCE6|nr:M23 family metallopeptidase [Streptomyces sp. YIM 130001]RII21048.1 Glycyl-glycine endopeptidase LytM precursor [Streptomyces sp. YIM 130001]
MNDQHGFAAGYDGAATGAFDATSFDADPLFGAMPGTDTASHSGQWDNSAWSTGSYDTYGTGSHDVLGTGSHTTAGYENYDGYATQYAATTAYDTSAYGTGSYDTTAMWATTGQQPLTDIPNQPGPVPGDQWDGTGQWSAPDLLTGAPQGFDQTQAFEAPLAFGHPQPATGYETGAYDATAWNTVDTGGQPSAAPVPPYDEYATPSVEHPLDPASPGGQFDAGVPYDDGLAHDTAGYAHESYSADDYTGRDHASDTFVGSEPEAHELDSYEIDGQDGYAARDDHEDHDAAPAVHFTPGAARGGRGRSRRRAPARRSALLTVAVPSVCALGVAGIAAASVSGGLGGTAEKDDTQTQAAPDPDSVKPSAANNQLDTQLANLSADADDFADRASRTQERIDLKERQAAEKKRKAEEAARKEAARPKFALPTKQQGLSAYYGQAGVNWMSAHSGIDFPVSYGTEVLAATDGTVRTQWNPAYGNMAIVTAEDGTETWYCHLSSTKIRSGSVKAGDAIAYSGNSGNSTGPHLHFEVRPGGGSAIDPLAWLREHGLDPT